MPSGRFLLIPGRTSKQGQQINVGKDGDAYKITFGAAVIATGAPPFDVAPKILAARDQIDPDTVIDMTASTDTIGGSSGSPAINAAGEIIGANFDSTVLTQRNAYGYDRDVNRSVLVSTEAITTVMRDVYGMDHLLAELGVE